MKTKTNMENKILAIVKSELIRQNQAVHIDRQYEDIEEKILGISGLEDACALLRVLKKEVDTFTSKTYARDTKIRNLKVSNFRKSSLVKGIDVERIEKLVTKYPEKSETEIRDLI